MKTIMLAICGILAVSIHTTQANAAATEVAANAVQLMQEAQTAKAFQAQLEQKLGVKIGSVAELNAALGKLSQAERAGVVAAINSYASKAVVGNGDGTILLQNEKAARAAFTTNGTLKTVAAMAQKSASRDAVADQVLNGQSCDESLPQDLAAVSGLTAERTKDLLVKKVIPEVADCGKEIKKLSPKALKTLMRIADCGEAGGALNAAPDQETDIFATCAIKEFANDNVKIDMADARSRIVGLQDPEACRMLAR